MPLPETRSPFIVLVAAVAVVGLCACGGADARKARHLEKGQAFLAADNVEKARVEFRNALQIAPNDSEARYENGVVDEKLGNPREAAQYYQGAIDSNSDNARARAALGRLYLFSGAPDRAMELIKPALVTHPEDAGLLTVRAAAYLQLKDQDSALADAEHAVILAPSNEDSIAVLAGIYNAKQQTQNARELLESAVKRIPGSVDLRLALAQLYSGLGMEPQVEALLIELVKLKPAEKAHRLRLAQYYARLNHTDEAERVLREAIKTLPGDRDLKTGLIDFLVARRGREVAAKELDQMIAADPKDYQLTLVQAQFYEQGKDDGRAEAIYKALIAKADPDAAAITARNRLAALRIQSKDPLGAEKLLAEVLAKNPRDNDALVLRGNLALAEKDQKTAIIDLRAVLRDQPNAIGVMRSLARAHLANGEPALAEETMRRAVDVDPKDYAARLDLGQLLAQLGKPDQAKPVIDELVKQRPDNVTALDTQFKIAMAMNNHQAAKISADALVSIDPKAALGYFYQGDVAESEKRLNEALRLYESAAETQPDAAEPMQAVARILVKLNREPEALKRLDDSATRFPALPTPANIKGDILLTSRQWASAATAFKSAIEREPKWWVPYRGLALAQSSDHDIPAAVATLQLGIAKTDRPDVLDAQLASILEGQGKNDDAIRLYEDALRKDPHSDVAANNLAMLLITYKTDQPSLDRAKQLSQGFLASSNAEYIDTYGWVLYKRGESAAAVAALQAALSKTPDSPVSLYHLGMAQASAGQPDEARVNLSRSLKSGRNFTGKDEAKATLDKIATVGAANAAPKS
jgi:tetratricopeptide (TPR) repeat protein